MDDDAKLDNELKRIYGNLSYLWKKYGFSVRYLTRSYGIYDSGFMVGLENEVCRLVFEKETNAKNEPISIFAGKKYALFKPPDYFHLKVDGWYPIAGLTFLITGVQCERFKNVDQDLESLSQYIEIYMDRVIELFKYPDEFEQKMEHYRNSYKGNQITVENIKAERARLYALGQDSSLKAAIASLRGDKNE